MCQDRDCPWLQPTVDNDPQPIWGAGYRDVVILDAQNRFIEVFNLTTHDLRIPAEYEDLKARLLAAANP